MQSKKWVFMFLGCLLSLPLLLMAANFIVDPFAVFGNMTWYSFSETLNPRVAKTTYLKEHGSEYDSYLVGCSSTSSYPVDALNEYLDASFYNTISYGVDMKDAEETVGWLLDNCTVRNIVLNVYVDNGVTYDTGQDQLTLKLHGEVSGENPVSFYGGYLLADPNYILDKLKDKAADTELSQTFDVFDEETGAYDKRARDVENIGDLERYYEAYPVFTDYPVYPARMGEIENTMKSVAAIRDMCEAADVDLYVVCAPVYGEYLNTFTDEDLTAFYTALAEVTDYWDFTYSSVSWEPRYFYDATHFRNAVGDMALAKMFGDDSIYIPEDFGAYVTAENVADHVRTLTNRTGGLEDSGYTCEVPVLMYHHIAEEGDGGVTISADCFEEQIAALHEAGYTAVSLDDLYAYVEEGRDLPEKPILITFDDGYESNYQIAFPILEEYGMEAVIFTIGVSVGKDTYKDTGVAITPHFSYEEAREMAESGVISIQSHTYDMHQSAQLDAAPARTSAVPLEGESEEDYMAAFLTDMEQSMAEIRAGVGEPVTALAYPNGDYTTLSQALCAKLGLKATFTTEARTNVLIKGLPQCLYGLGRYNVEEISGAALLELLRG